MPGCAPHRHRGAENGKIAFSANYTADVNSEQINAPGDIYTVQPNGSEPSRLTRTGDATHPVWSPDARRLAYVRTDWRGDYAQALWVMNADGSGQRLVQNLKTSVAGSARTHDWSPDNRTLVLDNGNGIALLDLRTEHMTQLPTHGWHFVNPRWSADGTRIAVAATPPNIHSHRPVFAQVYTMAADGSDLRSLAGTRRVWRRGYDWSWVTCKVVFAAMSTPEPYDTCDGDLYLADPRTRGMGPLVVQRCVQSDPAWSPDGRQVAFENHGGLWVADADGRNPHQIVASRDRASFLPGTAGSPNAPDWQPVR